ncbi:MAG TPA: ABC-2 family transporter protein [Streptosporangiaceae bacterium]|jgi:ABC-2 type transport system permease protein
MAQYPASLAMFAIASFAAATAELGAIFVVFAHAGRIAGFGIREALLFYGLSAIAFTITDFLLGSVERLGNHIRRGTFDTMLVRPVSPLVQLATDEFSPRRLGKVVPGAIALAYALGHAGIHWTPARIATVPVLVCSAMVICGSIWVIGACVQFFVTEAGEVANSVTYGGQALAEYPLAIYGRDVVRAVTFVVPLAFVSWQPGLYLLGRPDPLGLPAVLRYAPPVVAAVLFALAALVWRVGLRRYRSTGS